ncbi:MAG: 2-oxo-4-hydroxy-4-carboxy-5-ureidoimidazoline decarboxylase [Betaproteobacteria bacterium]|nr:2-oxo-4-hydroxy-4-carboxy-5-ureidoimidazoline decarboxylase [Betaproteobacteria bacterium]
MTISIHQIDALDREAFIEQLGGIYEHSPWVAERTWKARPFRSRDALHAAMEEVVAAAGHEEQLALIRAHPELAGRLAVAGQLTGASRSEQAGAGLDRCTPEEFARLQALNAAYRKKFEFPFIVAVRGLTRTQIIGQLEQRLAHSAEQEFSACLLEIGRIAGFRLHDLIG